MTHVIATVDINFWWEEMVHQLFLWLKDHKIYIIHYKSKNIEKITKIHFQQYHPFPISSYVGIQITLLQIFHNNFITEIDATQYISRINCLYHWYRMN